MVLLYVTVRAIGIGALALEFSFLVRMYSILAPMYSISTPLDSISGLMLHARSACSLPDLGRFLRLSRLLRGR